MYISAPFAPEAHNDFFVTFLGAPWKILLFWLVLINLAAFFTFGLDKWKAKRKERRPEIRRVPEKTLFLLALLGGTLGAIAGMFTFHHKTRHWYFCWGLPLLLAAQIALAVFLALH